MKKTDVSESSYLKRLQTIIYGVQERNRWLAHQAGVSVIDVSQNLNGLSPTNARIASVGREGKIKLWSLEGNLIRYFSNPEQEWRVALSHDGQLIASTGSDGKVRIRNIKTGVGKSVFLGSHGSGLNVEFSPDDSLVASSGEDATIKLWKIKNTGYEGVLPIGFNSYQLALMHILSISIQKTNLSLPMVGEILPLQFGTEISRIP
jgi:WD40 repeat protein